MVGIDGRGTLKERITFGNLYFEICEEQIKLVSCFDLGSRGHRFVEVQIAGENHNIARGAKQFHSSEYDRLKYVAHFFNENVLTIVQRSELVEVKSIFEKYNDTNAVRIFNIVTNISASEIILEHVSSFVLYGIYKQNDCNDLFYTRFTNGHHCECQPRRASFFDLGLFNNNGNKSAKRIAGCNTGSWSSKEELPQGIIEYAPKNYHLMFQIENDNSWYYEISDDEGGYYLNLGGPNQQFNSWCKKLAAGEEFQTVKIALGFGHSLNEVIGEMTKYRRHIVRHCRADNNLPTIFNEYMHLSWDSPNEERTKQVAYEVAEFGIDYYVIDCGWHNEEPGEDIYPYVGQWRESKARFPHGIKTIIDYIHSLGMKAGLWLEPEIIGHLCSEMQDYYDDDCFFVRNGKRITEMGRQFLDFRNTKVVRYMTEVVRRLVEEYGVDYLKFDYNEDCGAGTELSADSLGDGLMQCRKAYFDWVDGLMDKYPDLIIENCSSGGMKLDYHTLAVHSLTSTSDQIDYRKYPYITANILSAVLPEQAAVWSYPVETYIDLGGLKPDYEILSADLVGPEAVAMNMINAFLGRLHLASRIGQLNDKGKQLVKEGVAYIKKIALHKDRSLPYFPLGFSDFNATYAAAGLRSDDALYLAVWNMKDKKRVEIPLKEWEKANITCVYPDLPTQYSWENGILSILFESDFAARFFEVKFS